MKTIHRFSRRALHSLLIVAITISGRPAVATRLQDRLTAIDQLTERFRRLGHAQNELTKEITRHEGCRIRRERTVSELEACFLQASRIQSRASDARALTYELLEALSTPPYQPVPESFARELDHLTENFAILGILDERLEKEGTHLRTKILSAFGSKTCDDIVRSAPTTRSNRIVIDVPLDICRSLRAPRLRITRTKFMTEKVSVSFDESEGAHISQGESDSEGHEDGGCIGRRCGDHDASGAGNRHEGHRGSDPSRYDRERMRDWAKSDGESERPAPLTDDQVMEIERSRFEKETAERVWNEIAVGSATSIEANSSLDRIPETKLYELDSSQLPQRSTSRVSIALPTNAPADATSLELRVGITRHALSSARPSTWQGQAAKDIGIASADEAVKSIAKGDLADAEHATTIAEGMTDIALGLTPGVGWAKDVIEAVTGRNLVTGAQLDTFDRSMAIIGSISFGVGSKIGVASKALKRVAQLAEILRQSNASFVKSYSNAKLATNLAMKLKLDDVVKLWTRGPEANFFDNMSRHVDDHLKEFPQFTSFEDYVLGAHDFIKNPPAGVLKKIRGTDRLFYHPDTNTFASATNDMVPKTMFKPREGNVHWKKQAGEVVP